MSTPCAGRIHPNIWHSLKRRLTVSGQTAGQLLRKLKKMRTDNNLPVAEEIVLMIGTNDILRKKTTSSISTKIKSILHYLSIHSKPIFLLTLPPIHRLESQRPVRRLNAAIKKLGIRREHVHVVDANEKFYEKDRIIVEFFERVMGANRRRDDIHWNVKGMRVVLKSICKARGPRPSEPVPQLSADMEATVQQGLAGDAIATLREGCWLSDEVIRAYLQLVVERSTGVGVSVFI